MKTGEIYYFSGSGNSLAVARDLAKELNASVAAISSLRNQEHIESTADTVGLVFPLQDFKAPVSVRDFIHKIPDIGSRYLFAVCTYGIAPLHSMKDLDREIRALGGKLAAGFAVAMPHNGIGSIMVDPAEDEFLYEIWKMRLPVVCSLIQKRETGILASSSVTSTLFHSDFFRMTPSLRKFLKRMITKGVDSMAFTADERCNGCGICEKVCPVQNIELEENRPRWSDRCVNCFACLHWCPTEAISPGGLEGVVRQYHHPDVKLSDMILR